MPKTLTFKEITKMITEGGNARATNKTTNTDTLAQKIPIKDIGRSIFIKKFVELFKNINKRYNAEFKEPLWQDESILHNGLAFNGSTSFIMNPEIHDDDVIPFKPSSGDLDIMIPKGKAINLWHLLDKLEGKEIISDVVYMGMNRLTPTSITDQMNCVFEVKFGDIVTQSQVDFELSDFDGDTHQPTEYSRFSHSSSLKDAQSGFKGVGHKYLLRALAAGASTRDDVVIITAKSTFEKYTIQKKNNQPIVPNFLKFSVQLGLRNAYEQQFTPDKKEWKIDNKYVYKEIPTAESNYETSISNIFKILFANGDSKDLDKMWSFVGIVELMKKYLDQSSIDNTFERMLDICWGNGSQKLERDHAHIDLEVKSNLVNYMIKVLGLKKYDSQIQDMIDDFYKNYNSKPISESKFREFIREDGEAGGTVAADIAPVETRLNMAEKPCKKHNKINCKECKKQREENE